MAVCLLNPSLNCIIVTAFLSADTLLMNKYELMFVLTISSWFLVHPTSKTHWATRFLQLLLSSTASSTSSQLMPIFLKSFLTTSFQFCCGRPGLLLKPSGSHMRACRGSLWWSIRERCPSHLRRLQLIMSSSSGSAVASLTFSFVTFSFQEIPRIPCCDLCYSFSLHFNGHSLGEPGLASVYWSKGLWKWWWQLEL